MPQLYIPEVNRCLLCYDAKCSKACPSGIDPAKLIRSVYFDNEVGAELSIRSDKACLTCDAPCQKACVLDEDPIRIKGVMETLHEMAEDLDPEDFENEVDLSCDFCGVKLENPFLLSSSVVASSYDKIARAFEAGWAGAAFKTICVFTPREVSPRYAVTKDSGHFVGFKNVEQLSQDSLDEDLEIIRKLKEKYPTKVIFASIMGRNEKEWETLAGKVEKAGADVVECNFSCPNMEDDGLGSDIGQNPIAVGKFTAAARKGCKIPLIVKLTPNVASMTPMVDAAMENGADGIAAINTIKSLMGMNLDTFVTEPTVNGYSGVGGYSGKAVKPIALRFIHEIASNPKHKNIPITGMGGIETWSDAVEFMLLGANHVQVTTAVMEYGYRIVDDMIEGLKHYLSGKDLKSAGELVRKGVNSVADLDDLDRESILYPKFELSKCNGCGRCYISCRDGGHDAITMKDDKPRMNPSACVGCHLCVYVCPEFAILGSGSRRIKGRGVFGTPSKKVKNKAPKKKDN